MSDYRSVLFLIADDWSRIAKCYGDSIVQTPHIDQLAEQGVVFDYAFCTSPSCAVSRACILTGQHSHTHG
ncbi:MAG: sulfatase-like hydrolase/transferase, partial [Candidatus Poribacteria bacterium]|nr:sulfatase-like hydrolase/transferase [Candidatus Poribacteria bacterium]